MSRTPREEVERVASLARLRLDPSECEMMARHFDAIFEFFEQLRSVSTEGVSPTVHILPLATPMREEGPSEAISPTVALRDSPASEGTSFSVPKVLDEEAEG